MENVYNKWKNIKVYFGKYDDSKPIESKSHYKYSNKSHKTAIKFWTDCQKIRRLILLKSRKKSRSSLCPFGLPRLTLNYPYLNSKLLFVKSRRKQNKKLSDKNAYGQKKIDRLWQWAAAVSRIHLFSFPDQNHCVNSLGCKINEPFHCFHWNLLILSSKTPIKPNRIDWYCQEF